MADINPDMIIIARESRGMTQSALAKKLSVPQGNLSRIESGLIGVTDEIMGKISRALDYPEDFFRLTEQIYGPGISGMGFIYHRKRQTISSKTVVQIQAQMNIRRMHVAKLLQAVDFSSPNEIPKFDIDDYNGKADEIARAVRAAWNLPTGPINNLTHAIESAGGIIIKCDFGTSKIDALSQHFPGLPPLFFVNSAAPGDRLRFTLAHELGHIVMHRVPNPHMEDEADQFAAEFLVPKYEFAPSLTTVSLRTLANLKPYWKVSMAALLFRAHALKKITLRNYQYLWMQMGKAGYRKREPAELEIPLEEPVTLKELINIYKNKLTYNLTEISHLLALNENETQSLYFQDQAASHLRIIK